jgi:hypothetical protein
MSAEEKIEERKPQYNDPARIQRGDWQRDGFIQLVLERHVLVRWDYWSPEARKFTHGWIPYTMLEWNGEVWVITVPEPESEDGEK